ncbi:hypothetical protein ACOMHN_016165 [Nucella lapillus]
MSYLPSSLTDDASPPQPPQLLLDSETDGPDREDVILLPPTPPVTFCDQRKETKPKGRKQRTPVEKRPTRKSKRTLYPSPRARSLSSPLPKLTDKSSLLSPNWRKSLLSLLEEILTPHPGGDNAVVLSLPKTGDPELHPGIGYRGSRPAPPLLRSRISPCSVDRRVDSVPPRRLPHRLAFNRVRPVRSP